MTRKLIGITLLFTIIGFGICMPQKQNDRSKIRVLLMSGKKMLANGDSVGAKMKFEEVLRLDPSIESAKTLLSGLENISTEGRSAEGQNAEGQKTEEPVAEIDNNAGTVQTVAINNITDIEIDNEDEIEAGNENDAVTVTEPVYEPGTTVIPDSNNPFAGAIRHKKNQNTTNQRPANTSGPATKQKQPIVQHNPAKPNQGRADTKKQGNDILTRLYKNTNGKHLVNFGDCPISPLVVCAKADANANMNGKWMSSLRNMRDNGHEMFAITIDVNNGTLSFDNTRSEFLNLCKSAGYNIVGCDLSDGADALTGEIEIRKQANKREDVIRLVNTVLRPFLGEYVISDYQSYKWMVEGDLVTDTIISEPYLVPCENYTAENVPENLDLSYTEPTDSCWRCDTTYSERRVIPPYYDVCLKVKLNIGKADKLLPSTLDLTMTATSPTRTLSISEVSLPLTFVPMPDNYQWIQANKTTTTADSLWYNNLTKAPKDMHTLNNLGYAMLNGIGTDVDYAGALRMFEDAFARNSKEACANLYMMYREGLGTTANMDKALEYLSAGRDKHLAESLYLSSELLCDIGVMDDNMTTWLDEATKLGNPSALIMLGRMYENGMTKAKSSEEATRLYDQARDMMHIDGGYNSARMMLSQDSPSQAYTYATAGAKLGSPQAMQMIAEMYITGIVVRPDMRKAVMWLNKMQEAVKNRRIGYMYDK